MSRRKTNPRKAPVSVAVAEARARNRAAELDWAIFTTVLRDKEGYNADGIERVWTACEALADSIAKGYVRVEDLKKALREETREEGKANAERCKETL